MDHVVDFPDHAEARSARRWLALAVGSLILAGAFASALVVGRTPAASRFVTDPLFFRRCLVVHVDLALLVWIYAFCAALFFLLPARGTSSRTSRVAVLVSAGGVLLMLASAGASGAEPVLANYVPAVDHWSFGAGLTAFGAGVVLSALDSRLFESQTRPSLMPIPAAAIPGLRATAVALLLAALSFAASWLVCPTGLSPRTRFELTAWGGGHVLQLASTSALLSVWLILANGILGEAPLSRRWASRLFAALVLPWLAAPLLAMAGPESIGARSAFTNLMRFGLFPVTAVVMVACGVAIRRAWRSGGLAPTAIRDPRLIGLLASAALAVVGWVLGALIRGSTTMIPAHYHAAIGAVTVAFMAVSFGYLEALGIPVRSGRTARRLATWQPAVFGAGQMLFAIGFAIAGVEGTARKVYGSEQHVRTAAQWTGLTIMGVGGVAAISGGVLFLVLIVRGWLGRARRRTWSAHANALSIKQPGGNHGRA